jgi:hypothetical protein
VILLAGGKTFWMHTEFSPAVWHSYARNWFLVCSFGRVREGWNFFIVYRNWIFRFTSSGTWCFVVGYVVQTAWPWRWRHYSPSKRWELHTQRHSITSCNTAVLTSRHCISITNASTLLLLFRYSNPGYFST